MKISSPKKPTKAIVKLFNTIFVLSAMLRKQIIDLLEQYAVLSNQPVDHFNLYDQKFRYEDEYGEGFGSFYAQFIDIAEFARFNFEIKHCSASAFQELLKKQEFPIIVFKKQTNDLVPILVKPKQGKGIKALEDEKLGWVEISFSNEAELISNIKTSGEMQSKHGYSPDLDASGNKGNDTDIVFIAGFSIGSSFLIEGEKGEITPLRRFFRLLKNEKKDIYTIYFFAIMIALVNLTLPLGIQAIVGLMSGGLLLESVFVLMVLVILATLAAGWLQVQQLGIVEVLQQRLFAKTAFDFAFRIPRLKLEKLRNHYTPELINRFFDVLNVQKSLPKILIDFTSAIIQIVFGLLLLSFYHPYFILFGLLVIFFIGMVFYFTSKKGLETSIYESKYKYKVVYWLEELGRSVQSFKLAGYTTLPIHKIDRLLEKYVSYRKKHFGILVKQYSAIIAFKTLITAGLLVLGGALVFNEQINLGQFVASEIIIVLVINSVEKLIGTISVLYDMLTALDKIGQVTDLEIENNAGREVDDLDIKNTFELELQKVAYRFHEALDYSFKDISFTIHKGEKICITGYNDAGKTSLIKTVAGLFEHYEGVMKLNGISVRELNPNSYRSIIGDNLNLSDVFEGTIEENIAMGRPGVLLKDIMEACKKAHLESFISCLKKGLQTQVQPSGSNFPSNVVKKILLARSFVQNPSLILIDEFFHNVQSAEKQQILDTLFQGPYALLVVSNIHEVMKRSDKILVMQDGRIIAEGSYQQLLEQNLLPA